MKTLYKNTTIFKEADLYEVYKLITKETRAKYKWLWVFSLILSWIYFILSSTDFSDIDFSMILTWLWYIFLFFWIIFIILWVYLSNNGYKERANKFIEQQKYILNTNELSVELSFYEEKITQHDTNSKWSIDFFYNRFDRIDETLYYFVILSKKDKAKNRFFILVDKSWFTQWDPKTFKEFITSKIESSKEIEKQEKSKKTK